VERRVLQWASAGACYGAGRSLCRRDHTITVGDVTLTETKTPAPNIQENLIFDIGMDECQDTRLYLKKGFRVVAVDANPAVCEAGAKLFPKEVATGQLTILNRAISPTRAPLPFHVCRSLSMLSTADDFMRSRQEKDGHVFETIEVEGTTAADILAEFGTPYFAKVDIEGYDLICLRGFLAAPVKPRYLSTELDFKQLNQHIACLKELGYKRFALVGQGSVHRQVLPRPAREGRDVEHRFEIHCSGLFGRELPAEWFDAKQLSWRCWSIQIQFWIFGALKRLEIVAPLRPLLRAMRLRMSVAGEWYDVHATY
jgi:FkbM family methyltransferase